MTLTEISLSIIDPISIAFVIFPIVFLTFTMTLSVYRKKRNFSFLLLFGFLINSTLMISIPIGIIGPGIALPIIFENIYPSVYSFQKIYNALSVNLLTLGYASILFALALALKRFGDQVVLPKLTFPEAFFSISLFCGWIIYVAISGGATLSIYSSPYLYIFWVPLFLLIFTMKYIECRRIVISLQFSAVAAGIICLIFAMIIAVSQGYVIYDCQEEAMGNCSSSNLIFALKMGSISMFLTCLSFLAAQFLRLCLEHNSKIYEVPEEIKWLIEICIFFIIFISVPNINVFSP